MTIVHYSGKILLDLINLFYSEILHIFMRKIKFSLWVVKFSFHIIYMFINFHMSWSITLHWSLFNHVKMEWLFPDHRLRKTDDKTKFSIHWSRISALWNCISIHVQNHPVPRSSSLWALNYPSSVSWKWTMCNWFYNQLNGAPLEYQGLLLFLR